MASRNSTGSARSPGGLPARDPAQRGARATVELAASDPDGIVREAAEEALARPLRWR
jgi:hypothetical protein